MVRQYLIWFRPSLFDKSLFLSSLDQECWTIYKAKKKNMFTALDFFVLTYVLTNMTLSTNILCNADISKREL